MEKVEQVFRPDRSGSLEGQRALIFLAKRSDHRKLYLSLRKNHEAQKL